MSPLEEVAFNAETWDDFGLEGYGLTYRIPGSTEKTFGVVTNSGPNEKRSIQHLLRLEELHLEAGGLVSWFMWADDIGPDGKIRRTTTDIFFAQVRPFEEVFRKSEGGGESDQEPPPGQQESAKLLELQKQVVTATFKLQKQSAGKAGGHARDVDGRMFAEKFPRITDHLRIDADRAAGRDAVFRVDGLERFAAEVGDFAGRIFAFEGGEIHHGDREFEAGQLGSALDAALGERHGALLDHHLVEGREIAQCGVRSAEWSRH